MPFSQLARQPRHHLLRHLRVCLVLQVLDLAPARRAPDGSGERRDRAGRGRGDLLDDVGERQRLVRDAERTTRDRRDQRDLVAVLERAISLGVRPVDGVEQSLRLVSEAERGPDVSDALEPLEPPLAPAGAFAKPGEKTDDYVFGLGNLG